MVNTSNPGRDHPDTEADTRMMSLFQAYLHDRYTEFHSLNKGKVASYIPELACVDANLFGICAITPTGRVFEVGDSRQEFTVQSVSKALVYGLALEDNGLEYVNCKVGVEPSGDAFNSIVLDEKTNRPYNPMVNAGAIATTDLIQGKHPTERLERVLEMFRRYTGREHSINEPVFLSEKATGNRNRAMAYLMNNFGMISDRIEETLDLYFQQCSIMVTAYDLAMMAATLANCGQNPITGEQAIARCYVKDVLSVMLTCGMYDYSGEWAYRIGIPAKSGIGGGITAVIPGRLGVGTFSPALDDKGNSARGIKFYEALSRDFGLHLFDVAPCDQALEDCLDGREATCLDKPTTGKDTGGERDSALGQTGQTLGQPLGNLDSRADLDGCDDIRRDLEDREQQIYDYLQQVQQLTQAVEAVETDSFTPAQLQEVAKRDDSLGQLARVFSHMVETLQARAQELSAARDQLQAVLNAVPGSISWVNSNGVYLGVNDHLAQKFKLSPEIMIGKPIGSFNPSPAYTNFMRQFLASDRTDASQEVLIQGIDRSFHYLMAAKKYQEGEATVVVGIDMTDRHEAEEALRIAEENYRSIFENALEGIFQSSPDGRFLKVNCAMARIYGYDSPDEMLNNITDIATQVYVNPSLREKVQRRLLKSDAIDNLEYQVYRRDGSIIWIQENTRAVRDNQGNLLYFAGIVQDITNRKHREAELQRQLAELQIEINQQKRKKEVAQIASSDFFQSIQDEVTGLDLDDFWS